MRSLACLIGRHEWTSRVELGRGTRCARGVGSSLGGGAVRRAAGVRTTTAATPAVARALVVMMASVARPL